MSTVQTDRLGTHQKALKINLDRAYYGAFAEIGAGQEVARWFFRVGGASGTVAKTMSAYDMQVSDAIYGKGSRYVSRDRTLAMLSHEATLLVERLDAARGDETTFFAFADTVAARNFRGDNECHGWMGMQFQARPHGPWNTILLHVNLNDPENLQQQEALGILGVNLIYGAFFSRFSLDDFLDELCDGLAEGRLEVDHVDFIGPDLPPVDEESLGFSLVSKGLARGVLFETDGTLSLPSDAFHKRGIVVERGSFQEVEPLHAAMLTNATQMFDSHHTDVDRESIALFEITTRNVRTNETLPTSELQRRVQNLRKLGRPILVTNIGAFLHLSDYLRRFTREPIGFVVGVDTLMWLFNPSFYSGLRGGLLEAMGRLVADRGKVLVYPVPRERLEKMDHSGDGQPEPWELPAGVGDVPADSVEPSSSIRHLYRYCLEIGAVVPLKAPLHTSLNSVEG